MTDSSATFFVLHPPYEAQNESSIDITASMEGIEVYEIVLCVVDLRVQSIRSAGKMRSREAKVGELGGHTIRGRPCHPSPEQTSSVRREGPQ